MATDNQNSPPIRRDKEIEITKMELELIGRVVSDSDMRTQYTQSERLILSLLEQVANNPFSISAKIARERNIKFDSKRYEYPFFSDLLKQYTRKGKALERKGIKEDVDIMTAYCQQQIEKSKEKQQTPTYMK